MRKSDDDYFARITGVQWQVHLIQEGYSKLLKAFRIRNKFVNRFKNNFILV